MEVNGQLRGPTALPSEQRTLVLIKQQAMWAPGLIDTVPEKRSAFFPCRNSNSVPVLHLSGLCTY